MTLSSVIFIFFICSRTCSSIILVTGCRATLIGGPRSTRIESRKLARRKLRTSQARTAAAFLKAQHMATLL